MSEGEVSVEVVKKEVKEEVEEEQGLGQTSEVPDMKTNIKVEECTDGKRKLRIGVAGCSHGEMDKIYAALAELEAAGGYKFDLLICCGDYQAVRNYGDLQHIHMPEKYRQLQTFYKYYSGEKLAPVLTLFIGGNHEASGFLAELPQGGWVAPRIYYMGYASVVNFAGLRIAGLSGIFNPRNFNRGHFECPQYERDSLISAYHVRSVDTFRLKQLRAREQGETPRIDICLSHDWPAGITDYGDVDQLLRFKPYFRDDINSGKLGNPAAMQLVHDLRPRYWLSAHLHCQFAALVPHPPREGAKEEEELTRFLSLDKPIPHRHFVQSLEVESPDPSAPLSLSYDREWLSVLRSTDKFTEVNRQNAYLPTAASKDRERFDFRPTDDELASVDALGDRAIPENFQHTAPPLKDPQAGSMRAAPSAYYRNPQTARLTQWLGISDLNKLLCEAHPESVGIPYYMLDSDKDRNEIELDEEEFGDDDFIVDTKSTGGGCCGEEMEEARASDAPLNNSFLDDFQAPAWKGKKEEDGGEVVFKRRKVDFNEDE